MRRLAQARTDEG